jgi:glutamine amidotransferase
MIRPEVLIVDYGVGNLFSVYSALDYLNAKPVISNNPEDIRKYQKVILPGVGAFENGMSALKKNGADQALSEVKKKGTSILAICLGMQMLLDESEEFGIHKGLGFIPGKVKRIPEFNQSGKKIKIPHIGWSEIYFPDGVNIKSNKYLLGFEKLRASFYFVHSYQAKPNDLNDTVANCNYEGIEITAIIQKENVTGCQFHPEKSGKSGLLLLENFISI